MRFLMSILLAFAFVSHAFGARELIEVSKTLRTVVKPTVTSTLLGYCWMDKAKAESMFSDGKGGHVTVVTEPSPHGEEDGAKWVEWKISGWNPSWYDDQTADALMAGQSGVSPPWGVSGFGRNMFGGSGNWGGAGSQQNPWSMFNMDMLAGLLAAAMRQINDLLTVINAYVNGVAQTLQIGFQLVEGVGAVPAFQTLDGEIVDASQVKAVNPKTGEVQQVYLNPDGIPVWTDPTSTGGGSGVDTAGIISAIQSFDENVYRGMSLLDASATVRNSEIVSKLDNAQSMRSAILSQLADTLGPWVYDTKLSMSRLVEIASTIAEKPFEVNVAPPEVNVTPVVNVSPPVVNVEAPIVEAPVVNVEAPEVNVDMRSVVDAVDSAAQRIVDKLGQTSGGTSPDEDPPENVEAPEMEQADRDLIRDLGEVRQQLAEWGRDGAGALDSLPFSRLHTLVGKLFGSSVPSFGSDPEMFSVNLEIPLVGSVNRTFTWNDYSVATSIRSFLLYLCYVSFGLAVVRLIYKTVQA